MRTGSIVTKVPCLKKKTKNQETKTTTTPVEGLLDTHRLKNTDLYYGILFKINIYIYITMNHTGKCMKLENILLSEVTKT